MLLWGLSPVTPSTCLSRYHHLQTHEVSQDSRWQFLSEKSVGDHDSRKLNGSKQLPTILIFRKFLDFPLFIHNAQRLQSCTTLSWKQLLLNSIGLNYWVNRLICDHAHYFMLLSSMDTFLGCSSHEVLSSCFALLFAFLSFPSKFMLNH